MSRTYLVIKTAELDSVDFSQVLQTSADTVRRSLDGTKTIIKWEGDQPGFIEGLTGTEGPYTNEEMLVIVRGDAWTTSTEMP